WGYSCAYTNSISWSGPTRPLPHEINPQIVFERLFGDGSNPEERLARKQNRASLLDAIRHEVTRVQKNLPASDKSRLDDYLDDVREIERRLQIAAKSSAELPNVDIP